MDCFGPLPGSHLLSLRTGLAGLQLIYIDSVWLLYPYNLNCQTLLTVFGYAQILCIDSSIKTMLSQRPVGVTAMFYPKDL